MIRKKVNIYFIVFFIVVIIFFKPYYFTYFNKFVINFIYLNSLRLVFIIILILYLLNGRISRFIFTLVVFYFIKGLSTLINGGSYSALITEMYPSLAMCMFIEIGSRKNPRRLIEAFSFGLSLLVYINFIAMLLNPYGYSYFEKEIFFLRVSNQLAPLYILAVIFIKLKNIYNSNPINRIHLWLTLVICTYMVINARSGSNIIAWAVLLMYFIFPYVINRVKLFNFKTYVLGYVILFFSLIIYNVQERFLYLIHELLGSDITLSGRISLWHNAIKLIKMHPFFGYGVSDSYNIIFSSSGKYLSAHNEFIQLLFEGGIFSLFGFVYLIYLSGRKLNSYKKSQQSKILSLGILSIALVLFSESMGFFDILILLSISYNIENFLFIKKSINKDSIRVS